MVLGGETIGVETAVYLAEQGKCVCITRRGEKLATKMGRSMRRIFLDYVRDHGGDSYTGVEYLGITKEGLRIREGDGNELLLHADFIVLAAGMVSDDSTARSLEEAGFYVVAAGDCLEPRDIFHAIHEGFEAGLNA